MSLSIGIVGLPNVGPPCSNLYRDYGRTTLTLSLITYIQGEAMSLSIGIIGLPNVGKSTLFNALLKKAKANVSNYPFCTIEPNVGIVEVPDSRLEQIANSLGLSKKIPAPVKFIDIAGLVKDAHKGEGLGNQFLAHIRECDAIAHIVRFFENPNITHIPGKVDPKNDIETVNLELILKDLEITEKAIKKSRSTTLEKIKKSLEEGKAVSEIDLSKKEKEAIVDLSFLTAKPTLYVGNVDEKEIKSGKLTLQLGSVQTLDNLQLIPISAKLEAELSEFSDKEAKEYLESLGVKERGLDRVIKAAYNLLDLITFYTLTADQVQAWPIKKNAKAQEAAGEIHTDFARGFIAAEVINWEKLIEIGNWHQVKEKGLVRTEGKDYIVQDGDVVLFKANV